MIGIEEIIKLISINEIIIIILIPIVSFIGACIGVFIADMKVDKPERDEAERRQKQAYDTLHSIKMEKPYD